MSRIDGPQERPQDRSELVDLLAFSVMYSRLCSDEAPFDRKTMRLILDIHGRVSSLLLNSYSASLSCHGSSLTCEVCTHCGASFLAAPGSVITDLNLCGWCSGACASCLLRRHPATGHLPLSESAALVGHNCTSHLRPSGNPLIHCVASHIACAPVPTIK